MSNTIPIDVQKEYFDSVIKNDALREHSNTDVAFGCRVKYPSIACMPDENLEAIGSIMKKFSKDRHPVTLEKLDDE